MTAKKKTLCVGRYLVDVPAEADVSFSGSMLDGFDIVANKESESAFRQRIGEREAEIAALRSRRERRLRRGHGDSTRFKHSRYGRTDVHLWA